MPVKGIRKTLGIIANILVILGLVFLLSRMNPETMVAPIMERLAQESRSGSISYEEYKSSYLQLIRKNGIDIPPFYFSIRSKDFPSKLNWYVLTPEEKNIFKSFGHRNFNLETVYEWIRSINIAGDHSYMTTDLVSISNQLTDQESQLGAAFEKMTSSRRGIQRFIPQICWNGSNNQFHKWISKALVGDFGLSVSTGEKATKKLWRSLSWTIPINSLALIFATWLALILGIRTGSRKYERMDQRTSSIAFLLYALPSFWIGTILLVFLTSPAYGTWLDIFPSVTTIAERDWPMMKKLQYFMGRAILPVFCIGYPLFAYLYRLLRSSVREASASYYVRTALASGLASDVIREKYLKPNALFPLISLLAKFLPALIAGTIAIEVIFNIPGTGYLMIDSIYSQDWPVVYLIIVLVAVLTAAGNIMADFLYRKLDPRVQP